MRKQLWSIASLALLATACGDVGHPIFPTAPSQVPAPSPTPAAAFRFSDLYTRVSVGDVVTRRGRTDDSECVDLPGWDRHYFRITAPSDSTLDVLLKRVLETQPNQPVDLSFADSDGRTSGWRTVGTQDWLRASVTAGRTHQITVRYTFPGVEFELRSSLELN